MWKIGSSSQHPSRIEVVRIAQPDLNRVAVVERYLPEEPEVLGTITGCIAFQRHDLADAEGLFAHPFGAHASGPERLDRPLGNASFVVLDVEMDIDMRFYPFDLRDRPLQRHRLVDVELSLERVVCECGAGRHQRGSRGQGGANSESHAADHALFRAVLHLVRARFSRLGSDGNSSWWRRAKPIWLSLQSGGCCALVRPLTS